MISLVIPAYNEEMVLPSLFNRLKKCLKNIDDSFEVILIDDGSTDNTWDIIADYNNKYPYIKGIRLSRNFGHQAALSAGLRYVTGDAAVVMDADLQDPPEILKFFIEKWKEGYEVVYAVRRKRKESVFKKFAYFIFYRIMQKLADIKIPLDTGDFCLMDKKVIDDINSLPEFNRFVRGLRAWVGYRQIGIEYERHARAEGEPKYNFRKLMGLAINGLIGFSSLPLRLASLLGLIIAGSSFFGFAFFLIYRVFNLEFFGYNIKETPGIATIFLTVLFIGGIQLITIGIIGEYLGKIYDEVKRRPPFIARETAGFN